jgi:hypothetical protein
LAAKLFRQLRVLRFNKMSLKKIKKYGSTKKSQTFSLERRKLAEAFKRIIFDKSQIGN